MSKAMEALERLRPDKDCACVVCKELAEDYALLRDYITTTEAELDRLIELTPGGSDFTEAQECLDWLSDRMKNRAIAQKRILELEARIKELEEALIDAISVMKFYAISPPQTPSQTPQRICDMQAYTLIEKIEKIMAKDAALDGARKVEPEYCTRARIPGSGYQMGCGHITALMMQTCQFCGKPVKGE